MKRNLLLIAILFITCTVKAQNGLEGLVVEKYYISDGNDTNANSVGGILPVGSVTYRIYADMLPGYKFQAAYGVPGHEMRIETSTLFFNNEDRGSTSPTFSKTLAAKNTVMLDSWLSVGAACNGQFGIMKDLDNGALNVVNNFTPQVLQNNDPLAGIPLTQQDGMIAGTPESVTAVGITSEITVFDNQNDGSNGPVFATSNGSWASLNGSVGPDTTDNKVLIAQITTDGTFSFKLNIQIGTPTGGVENYVAQNPVGNEIQIPSLIYSSLTGLSHSPTPAANNFTLFPVPAHDNMTLQTGNSQNAVNCFYTIYDINGRVMSVKRLGAVSGKVDEKIDLTSLKAGEYFVELTMNGVSTARKFVVQ